jgi:glycosyltransferase involved in cell wall biosynthesis
VNNLARADTLLEQVTARSRGGNLVTVAVSLYNYAEYLPECLDSIAAQRHPNLDIIVVDDTSQKDNSIEVARKWLEAHADRFGRALLLQHARNQGLAQARNTAFEHARGDLIFVIDADNSIYPRAIEKLVATMGETRCQAAYTQLEFFGSETGLGFADVWRRDYFKTGNYVDAMALVSKAAWKKVGGYTHIEGGWEDYDFWCKFIEQNCSAVYVPEALCRYRVHKNSMLRTETAGSRASILVEMLLRHPWLELKT